MLKYYFWTILWIVGSVRTYVLLMRDTFNTSDVSKIWMRLSNFLCVAV